jgi:tetratricopeptide (TPR) repeat protein
MLRAIGVPILCCVLAQAHGIAQSPDNQDPRPLLTSARAQYRGANFAAAEKLLLAELDTLEAHDDAKRADALTTLGDVYVSQDEFLKAERTYSKALAIYRRLSDPINTALISRNLAVTYSLERRHDDALRVLQQALKLSTDNSATAGVLPAQILNSIGAVYYRQKKIQKAEEAFSRALEMASSMGGSFDMGELLNNLGVVYHAKREYQKAEDLFKRAMKLTESSLGPAHPELTFTLISLGILYTDCARYSDAEQQYLRALAILKQAKLETRAARLLWALSESHAKAGRHVDAQAVLAEAADMARRNLNKHPDMAAILELYSGALKKQGKKQEAEELRTEARRARVAAGLVVNAHN